MGKISPHQGYPHWKKYYHPQPKLQKQKIAGPLDIVSKKVNFQGRI